MLNLVGKLTVTGGAVSSIFLIENVGTNFVAVKKEQRIEKNTGNIKFSSIEDIELFEIANGCTFLYVDTWGKRELYTARGIFENINKEGRSVKEEVLQGANLEKAKEICKDQKGVVTLNNSGKKDNNVYVWELKTDGW